MLTLLNLDNLVSKYPHILLDGPNEERFYGIELARVSGLNEKIVENAKNFAYQIQTEIGANPAAAAAAVDENVVDGDDGGDDHDDDAAAAADAKRNAEYVERRARYLLATKLVHMTCNLGEPLTLEIMSQLRNSFEHIKENVV